MNANRTIRKLPLWTWFVPLLIFAAGSEIAILFKSYFGSSIFYLPLAFGIILLHWWGPRVLTPLYINSLIFSARFGISLNAPLVATHIAVSGFLSWFLFRKLAKGDCRLENVNDLLKFTVFGLMIPIAINSLYYPLVFRVSMPEAQEYWTHVSFLWLTDFTTCFAIVIPALYFFTPIMDRANLTLRYSMAPHAPHKTIERLFTNDVLIVLGLLVILSFSIDFKTYWFLYGICTLYLSVRHGFEVAAISNLMIFLLVYVMPFMIKYPLDYTVLSQNNLASIHLGMSLLYFSSLIAGRVITDLKHSENVMTNKNKMLEISNEELNKVNAELDRFVYSVSHDLSAPLKTIKGLVGISRLEQSPEKVRSYVEMINNRIDKLEAFISEVLDYSRSNRREIRFESLSLNSISVEVLEMHSDLYRDRDIEIVKSFPIDKIVSDKMLIKIILNNLVSNALKFHRKDVRPHLSISSKETDDGILIKVTDNGEGIPEDIQHKIFNMFFRGTLNSDGSGLGLYIAKEAANRIQGKITVNSKPGIGSEFTVMLPFRAV
jgi:signal transduction histidine kinase